MLSWGAWGGESSYAHLLPCPAVACWPRSPSCSRSWRVRPPLTHCSPARTAAWYFWWAKKSFAAASRIRIHHLYRAMYVPKEAIKFSFFGILISRSLSTFLVCGKLYLSPLFLIWKKFVPGVVARSLLRRFLSATSWRGRRVPGGNCSRSPKTKQGVSIGREEPMSPVTTVSPRPVLFFFHDVRRPTHRDYVEQFLNFVGNSKHAYGK